MINNLFNNLTFSKSDNDNVEQIGDNLYSFNLNLFNGSSRVGIKFAAVENLEIVDDLRYFYVYGTLTINYNNDVLESFESLGSNVGGGNTVTPYQFRGDGRDILEIDIMPQIKEQKCLKVYASESERKKFNIKHICSVYKYEDITSGKGAKQRKFYFWDRDLQFLTDINLNFSTSDKNKSNKSTAQNGNQTVAVSNSNADNSMLTGDIIEGILKKSLAENSKISFKKGTWDAGQSKLAFFSPANNKAIDDLTYILSYHISDTSNYNLPCLLKKERYTEKYNLIPLNKFYSSGTGFSLGSLIDTNVTEDFFLGKMDPASSGLNKGSQNLLKLGPSRTNVMDYNLIDDYTFVKIDARDLQKYLSTYVVHSNDPRGFFSSDLKENNYKNAQTIYDKTFVKSGNQTAGGSSNAPQNRLRKDNLTVQHTYVPESLDKAQRKSFGVNKGMINLFFKNTSITFKARGNTMRQTGKFFTVNRSDGNSSSSHDNTMLGKYMITYIIHQFKKGSYYNTIHGVKPYTNNKQNFVEGA